MPHHLDMGVLRSFLLIAEGRTFAQAAGLVNRSASAVSLQIQRLEADLGAPLFHRNSREVVLTLAGERLLGYARRLLQINDETLLAFGSQEASARVLRFGTTQDVAETALPEVLRRFSLEHPGVDLSLRVDRSDSLIEAVKEDALDVAIAIRRDHPLSGDAVVELPMIWIGREGSVPPPDRPLSLALFDPPCTFRKAALDSLSSTGRPCRVALASPSLTGLTSAVAAGLGLTVRTPLLLAPGLEDVGERLALPGLPSVAFSLYARPDGERWPAREDFIELCRRSFRTV